MRELLSLLQPAMMKGYGESLRIYDELGRPGRGGTADRGNVGSYGRQDQMEARERRKHRKYGWRRHPRVTSIVLRTRSPPWRWTNRPTLSKFGMGVLLFGSYRFGFVGVG